MTLKQYLPTAFEQYIHISRYSRWLEHEGRRETWEETVSRYCNFFAKRFDHKYDEVIFNEIKPAILNCEVMPSMRALMTAGEALDRDNIAGYNCAYVAISSKRNFSEVFHVLLSGTGVGFGCERQDISKLPQIPEVFRNSGDVIVVEDSKMGWAKAYNKLINSLYDGDVPTFDVSKVRPAGARLKTFGGRASGPEPLKQLFAYTIEAFKKAAGRKFNSIEVHGIVCKIADVVVVGGVRRSALISLSNLSDGRMRDAKSGQWWIEHPEYALANNSVAYTEKPDVESFLAEWTSLVKSKSGERGIFNRVAAQKQAAKFGKRDPHIAYGCNPCSEIILRPSGQMCNLSEIVVRNGDNEDVLMRKARLATIIGTMQASLTDFQFVGESWKKNTVEEALLGVSLTGTMDNPLTAGVLGTGVLTETLERIREYTVEVNAEWANNLGINASAAITCAKPSGCRPWFGLTTTTGGVLTLEELFSDHNNNEVWSDYVGEEYVVQDNTNNKILKTFVNGTEPVYRITTTYGIQVESTANHPWFVKGSHKPNKFKDINEFKKTSDIVVGDVLDIKLGVYDSCKEFEFVELKDTAIAMRNDCQKIAFPKTMNPDLAWFLGYLWGDGAMSPTKFRLRFTDAMEINHKKAARILEEQFGILATYKQLTDRKALSLEVANKYLWHWLIKNGVWKYFADKIDLIPECVRRSSQESIVAFISGLFDADGCISKNFNEKKLTLASADKFFAKHVQDVGLTVGLCFGMSHNQIGDCFQASRSMYLMNLTKATLPKAFDMFKKHSNKSLLSSPDIPWFIDTGSPKYILGKVKAVEYIGEMPTFDVEVENEHWFYAGAVKSHNTVSQLVNSSSGIHARHSQYYLRTVRTDKKDPLYQFMQSQGVYCEDDVMKPDSGAVFYFPIKSEDGCITRNDMTAIEQLEMWLLYQRHWCHHKPSVTISVREHEWFDVGAWAYKHFDELSGVSFLPHSEHSFQQAPYQEVTKEEYDAWLVKHPLVEIDWAGLQAFEKVDTTTGTQQYSCSAGVCEIL